MTIHSLTLLSAKDGVQIPVMDALPHITTGQEMQQVPELIWLWWLKDKYMFMPVIEPQVAQCHIHITKLFQHSDYVQKCSNLYTVNVVLHHCSLPGCTKWCILISSKKATTYFIFFAGQNKQLIIWWRRKNCYPSLVQFHHNLTQRVCMPQW